MTVAQCNEKIEYYTLGKGKNNPAFTCIALAKLHLRHREMLAKWKAIRKEDETPMEEFEKVFDYLMKYNLISKTALLLRFR